MSGPAESAARNTTSPTAVSCVESPAQGGRPHAQALSPGPHELCTLGDLQQPPLDTHHGLITRRPAQASHQHQELLFPRCGAGRGPPGGLGVLQDPEAPGGRTTQPPTRRWEMLYAPHVSPADSKAQSSWFWHFPHQALLTCPSSDNHTPHNSQAVCPGAQPGSTAGRGWLYSSPYFSPATPLPRPPLATGPSFETQALTRGLSAPTGGTATRHLARLQGSECLRGFPRAWPKPPPPACCWPCCDSKCLPPHPTPPLCGLFSRVNRGSGSPPPGPLWVSLLRRKSWGLPCYE